MYKYLIILVLVSVSVASTITWQEITPKGPVPSPRYDFAYGYNSKTNKLYVFGGKSASGSLLGDFYIYDVGTNTWTEITNSSGSIPPPLSGGAGVVFNENFYVIGGEIAVDEYLVNTFEYNDAKNSWNDWVLLEPIIGASIFNWGDNYIYYFGGLWSSNTHLGYSDDLYVYDGYQTQWFSVVVATSPPGRMYASMVHAPSPYNRTVVFGGLTNTTTLLDTWFMLDTGLFEEKTWYEVPKQYYPWPSQRYGALMEYDATNGNVILFGGGNSTSNSINDLWAFNFGQEAWNPVTVKGTLPPGRMLGSIAVAPTGYLIFGGVGGSSRNPQVLNDMWLLSGI